MGTQAAREEVERSHQHVPHTGRKEGEVEGRQGWWQSQSVLGGRCHAPP